MRTRFLRPLAGLFLASCLVTPVMAETLSDALRQAYDESPRLESERARLRATDDLGPARGGVVQPCDPDLEDEIVGLAPRDPWHAADRRQAREHDRQEPDLAGFPEKIPNAGR